MLLYELIHAFSKTTATTTSATHAGTLATTMTSIITTRMTPTTSRRMTSTTLTRMISTSPQVLVYPAGYLKAYLDLLEIAILYSEYSLGSNVSFVLLAPKETWNLLLQKMERTKRPR